MGEEWLTQWQLPHNVLDCDRCDALFLHPIDDLPWSCPLCGYEQFTEVQVEVDALLAHEPELVVPFAEDDGRFRTALAEFRQSLRLPPVDFMVEQVHSRTMRLFWPMWLVDADVKSQWQAEAGFDYDAMSYGERFAEGKWRSTQTRERRVRWEPRLGKLTRRYHNQASPAIDEHLDIVRWLGQYDVAMARPFNSQAVERELIRLPTRTPQDAWPSAEPEFQKSAAEECQMAAGAHHIRLFKWAPTFTNHGWSQMLLPLLATYYIDDEGTKCLVLLHGQTGKLVGTRRASVKRGQRMALATFGVAVGLFLVTAVAWLLPLLMESNPPVELVRWLLFFGVTAVLLSLIILLAPHYLNHYHFKVQNEALQTSLFRHNESGA